MAKQNPWEAAPIVEAAPWEQAPEEVELKEKGLVEKTGEILSELGSEAGEAIGKGLEKVESVTFAPARSAYLSLAAGEPAKAPEAFKQQFGAPVAEAPTMGDVMRVLGVPETTVPMLPPGIQSPADLAAYQLGLAASGQAVPKEQPSIQLPELTGMGAEMAIDPFAVALAGAGQVLTGAKATLPIIGAAGRMVGKEVIAPAAGMVAKGVGKVGGYALGGLSDIQTAEKLSKKTGVAVESALDQIRNLPDTVKQAWSNLKPQIRQKYIEQATLAQRTGIDVNLIAEDPTLLYGPDAFVTKAKKVEAATSAPKLMQNFDELQNQVSGALENEVLKVTKDQAVNNPVEAGQKILEAFDKKVGQVFDEAQVRYSNVLEKAGNPQLTADQKVNLFSKLDQISERQKQIAETAALDPTEKARAQAAINGIDVIINNLIDGNTQALVRNMQAAGKAANQPGRFVGDAALISPDQKVINEIYQELKNTVKDVVQKSDPKLLSELEQANKIQSEFFDRSKFLSNEINRAKNNKIPPERLYQTLVGSANSMKLKAINELFSGMDEMEAIRGQVLMDILAPKVTSPEGVLSPSFIQIRKSLENPDIQRKLNTLFGEKELADYKALIELGADMGPRAFNRSQSGVFLAVKAMKSPAAAIESAVTGKSMIQALERQSMAEALQGKSLGEIISLRQSGLFPEELLSQALKDRLQNVDVARSVKEAIMSNRLPTDVMNVVQQIDSNVIPQQSYSAIKNYVTDVANAVGSNLQPGVGAALDTESYINTMASSGRILSVIHQVRQQAGEQRPLFIPEQDRESVTKAIQDSPMSSIQKAKNLKALNTSGFLLDLTNIDQQKIIQQPRRGFQKPRSEVESLIEDRPNKLKNKKSGQLEPALRGVIDRLREE